MFFGKKISYYLLALSFACTMAQDCYTLKARKQQAGFFSIFNTVVGALDFIDRHNAQLIIDFAENDLYYDATVGPNWWSYYFEPISIDTQKIENHKTFKQYQSNTIFSLTAQFILSRERTHQLIEKYVHVKPHITEKIDHFVEENFKTHYVIGIHYRGTDKTSEAPSVAYEDVTHQIKLVIKQIDPESIKIFVATDDALFLEYMHQTFPGQVCAVDALRSHDNQAVHKNADFSNYKKGEDALIDCILLSKTNFLIKTASNLSDVSLQFNPSVPVIHLNISYFQ